ncbi:MAG: CHAT domain-containing protein [bacterium]|nr:CHAT domain-containing protein [bacterium]
MLRPTQSLKSIHIILLLLLLPILSCDGSSPPDSNPLFDLTGVPVSRELVTAMSAYRDAPAGQPDERFMRDLHKFEELQLGIRRRETRERAGEELYALWRAEPEHLLWIELGATMNYLLRCDSERNAVYALVDSTTAAGAFVRGRRFFLYGSTGEHYRRAEELSHELNPLELAWLQIKLAFVDAMHHSSSVAVRRLLAGMATARQVGGDYLAMHYWSSIAQILAKGNQLDDALHAAVMEGRIAGKLGLDNRVLGARLHLAEILSSRFEYSAALDLCDESYADAVARNYPWLRIRSSHQAATICRGLDDVEVQLKYFRTTLADCRAMQDLLNLAGNLVNIAGCQLSLGQIDSCLSILNEAEVVNAAKLNSNVTLAILQTRASCFNRLGDYERADSLLARADESVGLTTSRSIEIQLLLRILAQALQNGRTDMAYRAFERLEAIEAEGAVEPKLVVKTGLSKVQFLISRGEYVAARRILERIASGFSLTGGRSLPWRYHLRRGELAKAAGDLATATEALQTALNIAEANDRMDQICTTRFRLGHALLEQGKFPAARALLEGVELDEHFGGSFRSRLSTLLFRGLFNARTGRSEQALACYRDVARSFSDRSPADLKIRLHIEMGRTLAHLRQPAEAVASYLEALTQVRRYGEKIWVDELKAFNSGTRREVIAALLALFAEHPDLIPGKDPMLYTLLLAEEGRSGCAVPTEFAQRLIESDELTALYFVGAAMSHLWVAGESRLRHFRLPDRRQLQRLTRPFLADASLPGSPVDSGCAEELSTTLLGDVIPTWLPGHCLRIVPDDLLLDLPWGALPSPGRNGMMIDNGPIVISPALTPVADPGAGASLTLADTRILAIGIDDFAEGESGLQPLHHAEAEARAVVLGWPAHRRELRLGAEASWEQVTALELKMFDVIHIATHAQISEGLSAQTALRFSGDTSDTPVTVRAVSELKLDADLIYLSCCEAAGRTTPVGSGTMNLARAFLGAGSRAVIAPSIKVDDEVAGYLAQRFYHHWLEGRGRAEALRCAQIDVRDTRGWEHPGYWAFYSLIGSE